MASRLKQLSVISVYLMILVSESISQKPSLVCRAKDDNSPCLFPFVIQNITYDECVSLEGEDPWCIHNTNVSLTPNEIDERRSFCSQECLENRDFEKEMFVDHNMVFLGDEEVICRECINWKLCPWVANIVNYLKTTTNAKKKTFWINFIKSQRCGDNGRNICCKAGPKLTAPSNDLKFGTWKPQGDKLECGTSFDSAFIHGGDNSKLGEFPFQALLGYPYHSIKCLNTIYLCGGSLINKHYVLTAAHCLTIVERPLKEIVLGEHNLASNPDCSSSFCAPEIQRRTPIKVIVHEEWDQTNPTGGFDIGLVRLNSPVILASEDIQMSFVSPVCLPWSTGNSEHDPSGGAKAVVSGWGRVTNNVSGSYENYCFFGAAITILQKLETKIVSNEACNAQYSRFNVNEEQQICSGGVLGEDSCSGDSGGPLVHKANELSDTPMYQIGIVSFGTTDCGIGKPGVYTKVAHFLPWIEKSLEP